MLDEAIMKQMGYGNNGPNLKNQNYQYQDDDNSGDEYNDMNNQPMTLEQQKEELKRKLQMISSKSKKQGGNRQTDGNAEQTEQDDPDEEQARLRRKASGKFQLNDFKFLSTLGTGTFGRVRLVKHKSEPPEAEPLALKCLKKSEIIRLKQIEHVKSEKKILETINHPFIVNLKGTFQTPSHVFMLLDYACGGELFTLLRREGRFANDVALFFAVEIVLAFEYLHSMDIAYRDLKPENLLIDKEGHVKITDFGFAKVVNDRTYTLCGTPEYLAPEIIQSKGHNKFVDWWALGVLIFEMLAGYPPFYDDNPLGIYQKIMDGYYEFPPHIEPKARDLIKSFLCADRSVRLGCSKNGPDDVKAHKWFRGVDWNSVFQRKIPPPWVPKIRNPTDTQYFDRYAESAETPSMPTKEQQKYFVDF